MKNLQYAVVSFVAAVCLLPVAATGCSVEPAGAGEETEQAHASLGEVGCETAVKSADGTFGQESISAGNEYDPDGCPNQYLVGWGSIPSGHNAFADAFWEGATPTQTNCGDSYITIGCYSQQTIGNSWGTPVVQTLRGSWTGSSCTFIHYSGSSTCILNGTEKNRTAAEAYIQTCPTCTKTKRKVGIKATLN